MTTAAAIQEHLRAQGLYNGPIDGILGAGSLAAIAKALGMAPDSPAPVEALSGLQIGPRGIALVKQFEGCERRMPDGRYRAYPDPGTGGDPWTIGWGSTGLDIGPNTIWTLEQCDARFAADMAHFSARVLALCGHATQGQLDALTSFAYNCGIGNLTKSTLLKKHKAGDYAGAAIEFGKWNKAAGRVMAGLTRRRAAEAELYRSGA